MATEDEIAVVGIGCNFPGGEGIDRFWEVLENGRNCSIEIPPERFYIREWYDPDDDKPGKIRTTRAALLDDFNAFDNKLFGISSEEAKHMDPQQKLLLECTYRALEDAGVTTENIDGTKTGVFVGVMNRDFMSASTATVAKVNHFDIVGTAMSMAANRISYTFNLHGPSLAIDTACSSFLYALHFACKAIKQGDCEAALCGGVNCIMEPSTFVSLSKAKMLSPEGICKPFSRKADGYGRGEGCGVLLLKPLTKAKEDHNKIWGVISISAINQNGRAVTPITKPSQQEQENLLRSIYPSHVDPSAVQYIEAHGTGSPTGDPTEAESIGNVIGKKRSPQLPALKMGSVKGNIGHTESAVGAAGLIKVLLMMHHGKIVPSLHYSESSSSIDAAKLNLSVPTSVEKWEESSEFGRAAGINCFGFGGTNAHVVVRQVKQIQVIHPAKRPVELFVLSAASGRSLRLTIEDTARRVNTSESVTLPNAAYTSACRRSHLNFRYRKAFVASSLQHLEQQLLSAAETETVPSKKAPQLIFVFPGNGLNLKGIFKALWRSEPVFRDKCKEIETLFQQWMSLGILELTESDRDDLTRPETAQPLLFILQVALVTLLKYWGIKPTAAVGHSLGEVAAAHCAGFLSLEDAVKVIYHRSRLQAKATGGKMLVVGNIPVREVSEASGAYLEKVCIAAFNSPQSCTLLGEADSINAVQKELAESFGGRGAFLQVLNVPAVYHSHKMDPVLQELAGCLSGLKKRKPDIDVISTVSGNMASGDDFVTGSYWARQARDPVLFAQAIKTSAKDKENIVYVEIGPHRALYKSIKETLGAQTQVFPILQLDREHLTLLTFIKYIFELGFNVDWHRFYEGYQNVPSDCPKYQFDHKNFMLHSSVNQEATKQFASSSHPLICKANADHSAFMCSVSPSQTSYLYEHKNGGVALVPGSFFVELALAAVVTNSRPKIPLRRCETTITFLAPCILNGNPHNFKIRVESQKTVSEFRILSGSADVVYASGRVMKSSEVPMEEKSISLPDIFQRCSSVISKDKFYEALSQFGFHYGPILKQLNDVFYCEELKEVITSIKMNREVAEDMAAYCIHPILLDCFLQMATFLATVSSKSKVCFPSSISSLAMSQSLEEEMVLYVKTSSSTEDYVEFCGGFTDNHGFVLAELKRVRFVFVKELPRKENDLLFESKWKEITSDEKSQNLPKAPRVVVFADKSGIAQQLKNYLHSESRFVTYQDWDKLLGSRRTDPNAQDKINLELRGYHDVLFMWGIQKLNETLADKVLKYSVRCCEAFRQVVTGLRGKKPACSVTIITYRTSEEKLDHINPGFGLYGLARTCMIEVPEITFQIIDISSTNTADISALADVLVKYKAQHYPEIWINEGRIYSSEIRRTQIEANAFQTPPQLLQKSEICMLYTSDPYEMNNLSADVTRSTTHLGSHSIEIQTGKISIHSDDYFPVSLSSCNFGKTLYWNSHTTEKHKVMMLDFSGTVTATGSEVKKIKIGDHIVSCYPVSAASVVNIPETVCINTQKFPCFRDAPCMSFFWTAWVVFQQTLTEPKHGEILGIISSEPESVLCKVLDFSAQETGWKTILTNETTGLWQRVNQCNALIFLPPLNGIFKEALRCLFHLRDVVLVHGNQQPECLRCLIGSAHENIRVHTVNLIHLFQKASLMQSQKDMYWWLKSMNMKQFKHLPFSIFQQAGKSEITGIAKSYFNCSSIPVAVLKGDSEDINPASDITMIKTDRKLFKQNAAYIVTGELTGLGFETVKILAQNGGGHIAVLSCGTPDAETQKEINTLQDQSECCRIVNLQCDVACSSKVEKAVKSINKIFPNCPIKGVFHGAMVSHDKYLDALTMSDFEEVLKPKVAGAINLHCATLGQKLDHFVCYSSVSSFLGNAAQSNYAAANSFLDLFCHYRRNSGLSAQSINWGPLNLGVPLGQHHLQSLLQARGIEVLQINEIHEYLKKSLILNNPQQAVVKFNFHTLAGHALSHNWSPGNRLYSLVLEEGSSNFEHTGEAAGWNHFQDGPEDYMLSLLNRLCDAAASDLSVDLSLSSLGLDSVLAVTLQNHVLLEKGVEIPLLKILDPHATVLTLILYLKESLNPSGSDLAEDVDDGSWL